jgi:hypothetical protein
MDMSDQVAAKIEHIAEQLRLAISEYPDRIALDRIKFALSLTHFANTQIRMDKEATVQGPIPPNLAVSGAIWPVKV